ncbi:MAG: dihydrofolate reductase family protein [Chloroherpetonaceae bacterium]|nr:dihydrofolate reductase family protein [Chloroherpetonaceae bacterium]
MRNVILYIATTLDQFIAGPNDELDWLFSPDDFNTEDFTSTVDTVLLGRRTYEVMLKFGQTHYEGMHNFVFSHSLPHQKMVEVVRTPVADFVSQLKKSEGKSIWLVGGSEINTILLNAGLVDELILTVHPIYLNKGIPLFKPFDQNLHLSLLNSKSYPNGAVMLHYAVKK